MVFGKFLAIGVNDFSPGTIMFRNVRLYSFTNAWPQSEELAAWQLGAAMKRGAAIARPYVRLGEEAAQKRLSDFIERLVAAYDTTRDLPGVDGTSGLSENLALGEISPHQCWHAGMRARA